MAKKGRRPRAGTQISQMADAGIMMRDYPKTIPEALQRGDAMIQALSIRNGRQKAMLTRASKLLEDSVDECTCGGVQRVIEKSLMEQGSEDPTTEGESDGSEQAEAPDAEGH